MTTIPIDTSIMNKLDVTSPIQVGDMIFEDPAEIDGLYDGEPHEQEVLLVTGFKYDEDPYKICRTHRTIIAVNINSLYERYIWESDLSGFYWWVSASS